MSAHYTKKDVLARRDTILLEKVNINRNIKLNDSKISDKKYLVKSNQNVFFKSGVEYKKGNLSNSILSIQKAEPILNALNKFKNNKDYLRPNITIANLALKLKTNSKYLSKTINQYEEKSFSQYINDLRIEYLIEKLKTDKIYFNYTIKAIGKEIGFKNANTFSRAFFKKTGKYPSDYIKELSK